jgi:hypothetical protein
MAKRITKVSLLCCTYASARTCEVTEPWHIVIYLPSFSFKTSGVILLNWVVASRLRAGYCVQRCHAVTVMVIFPESTLMRSGYADDMTSLYPVMEVIASTQDVSPTPATGFLKRIAVEADLKAPLEET